VQRTLTDSQSRSGYAQSLELSTGRLCTKGSQPGCPSCSEVKHQPRTTCCAPLHLPQHSLPQAAGDIVSPDPVSARLRSSAPTLGVRGAVLGLRSGRSLVSVRLPLVYVAPPLMAGSDCQYREADWVSGLMAGTAGRLQYGYPDCGLARYLMQDSCSAPRLAVGQA
jgi:hypothetical protein